MKANFVMITPLLIILPILGLIGCDKAENTAAICKKNPELCVDLHRDSWCKIEKDDLIKQRYLIKQQSTSAGKPVYQLLLNLEDYNKCVELASGVQHILHPERTNDRTRAYGLSSQTLAELRESTKDNQDPYLSFYHWTRLGDQQAQQRVIHQQQQGKITDPLILAQLAAYYQKFDIEKAKSIYLSLLETATPEQFDPNWLLGLASIYQQQQDFEKTFLYSKANLLMTNNTASEQGMSQLIQGDKQLESFLTKQANQLVEHLNTGDYGSSQLRLQLHPSS
ncbi:DUF2989 domain-containing protein [Shewanella sp. Isolate11]|uniref:DUF2989 domain-containing protein n=1 Tax=Shewanella sp. Isolate11 TaxID=2908530 RepID=UPI001EFD2AD8|nr:DUF2989 domain-containing protein [Shewanella sp. Isolate11]MCG9696663.1 DUF2989 domain-containing protein [Shewanella sp. Isolate11]